MDNRFKGNLYIFAGFLLLFLFLGEFLLKAVIAIFALYLIYSGLQLRNDSQIMFYVHRFKNKF